MLPVPAKGKLILGPFLDFRRSYQHEAGGAVAAVWASLALLEELIGRDFPVADFAYNWVVRRVQSSSGYVGMDRVCRMLRQHKKSGRDFPFARQVRSYLAGTARQGNANEHDLARALAHFTTAAGLKHLEAIIRLKARLMANGNNVQDRRARGLLTGGTIKEVQEMIGQDVDVPWGLTRALAAWFTGGGSKGWIGSYIKLENSSSADRFFDEAERILSRARMDKEMPVQYQPPREEQAKLQQAKGLGGSQFRAYKALFLLDVLARLGSGGRAGVATQHAQEEREEESNE